MAVGRSYNSCHFFQGEQEHISPWRNVLPEKSLIPVIIPARNAHPREK
jgi:hypothetical protein